MESAFQVFLGINESAWWPEVQENAEFLGEREIEQGTCLRCINTPHSGKLPMFKSPYSFERVGAVMLHEGVEALGRVIHVNNYKMVPVRLSSSSESGENHEVGFDDFSWFEVDVWPSNTSSSLHKERGMVDGTILKCEGLPPNHEQVGLPIFNSTDSWRSVGYVQLGTTMVASGTCFVIEQSIPMLPIKQPYIGFVDGRFVNVLQKSKHVNAHVDEVDQANGHAGVSTRSCVKDCTQDAPATNESETSVWVSERLAIDPKDVHLVNFSGEVKLWDRDYFKNEADHEFVDRMLKANSDRAVKLWLERAGDISDYAEYGIILKSHSFQALGNRGRHDTHARGQNAIENLIMRGVANTRNIAYRAARQWRTELEVLPASLGYASPKELLDRFPRDPIFSHGDKVFVFWTSDNIKYEGVIQGFDYYGNYWIELDEFEAGALVEYQFLRMVPTGDP